RRRLVTTAAVGAGATPVPPLVRDGDFVRSERRRRSNGARAELHTGGRSAWLRTNQEQRVGNFPRRIAAIRPSPNAFWTSLPCRASSARRGAAGSRRRCTDPGGNRTA